MISEPHLIALPTLILVDHHVDLEPLTLSRPGTGAAGGTETARQPPASRRPFTSANRALPDKMTDESPVQR